MIFKTTLNVTKPEIKPKLKYPKTKMSTKLKYITKTETLSELKHHPK